MKIYASCIVEAPAERVFEIASDFRNAPQRISGIERLEILTDGPVGKGTRFKETRIMFKKEATEEMEVLEWDPPRSYTLGADSCGMRWRSVVRCTPEGPQRTKLEMDSGGTPLTLTARLMTPLGFVFKGAAKKAFEKDLQDLKRAAEGEAGPEMGGAGAVASA